MNDLKPFKHGEEGTHSVCNKHNIDGNSVCCECSGKDDCGDEPMNYTEKRLKLLWYKFKSPLGGSSIDNKNNSMYDLDSFVNESIQQAKAEEMKRVEDISKCPPPYPADKENPMKHIYQNEGYCRALDEILSYPQDNN